ncbi:MAG: RNA polymerase sigma factor, partial [Verrucomicrobiota bacterium]
FRRGLLRRVLRELESRRWFEQGGEESPGERAAMRALALLPASQREVLVLKFWHALTFEEIGRLLDLSPHTVAGRYRYGLQKIRRHLDQLPKDDHGFLPLLEAPAPLG